MPFLLALTWRFLLVLGLVFNPVVGMAMAHADAATATHAKVPPCHDGMASQPQGAHHKADLPGAGEGKNCGHSACQFGACCLAGTLDQPAVAVLPALNGSQAEHSHERSVAPAPPPSRMIRPPIA
jgi:hypothetical protein